MIFWCDCKAYCLGEPLPGGVLSVCQKRVSAAYLDQADWHAKAVRNIANSGRFSSDRTIRGYMKDIWDVTPAL